MESQFLEDIRRGRKIIPYAEWFTKYEKIRRSQDPENPEEYQEELAKLNKEFISDREYRNKADEYIRRRINVSVSLMENIMLPVDSVSSRINAVELSNLDVSDDIKKIDKEFRDIESRTKQDILEIDAYRAQFDETGLTFSGDTRLIIDKLTDIKKKIKDLKKDHISQYNSRVEGLNKEIKELKELEVIDTEMVSKTNKLNELPLCTKERITYRSNYFNDIKYNELVEMSNLINEIKSKLQPDMLRNEAEVSVVNDIYYTEGQLERLEMALRSSDEVTNEIKVEYKEELTYLNRIIELLTVKIISYKDKIPAEDLLLDAYGLKAKVQELEKLFNSKKVVNGKEINSEYNNLMYKIDLLEGKMEVIDSMVSGKTLTEDLRNYALDRINECSKTLEEIRKEVEDKYNNNLLTKEQYENIITKLGGLVEVSNKVKGNIDTAKMADNIYGYLNGKVSGIERAISELEYVVNVAVKPIKDKKARKTIEEMVKHIEKEIEKFERIIALNDEKDSKKDEELREKLDKCKDKLSAINKAYRKKCPLRVRAVKSAKEFYKKHKKLCLIAAGLAAIALVHATVGPILIPAIMHGNMIIGSKSTLLNGIFTPINHVLGNLIGASFENGAWRLASGTLIGQSVASTSLLKGLAISGIGSAIMIAPIVASIKKVVDKMKRTTLKDKYKEIKEKVKEKGKEVVDKVKEGNKEVKQQSGKENDLDYISRLTTEYLRGEKSFEEFCVAYELTDLEKEKLEEVIDNYYKKINEKGGR